MPRGEPTGSLVIDFPTEPLRSVPSVLLRSVRVFFANFWFLAAVTLIVFLPGKLLLQFICYVFNVPIDGILSYVLMDLSDLVLGALVAPAAIYGLVSHFRTGGAAPLGPSLAWGRRQFAKALWNSIKMEITILLWSVLLFVPGIVATVKLIFTDTIVAIEADNVADVLSRSRALSQGWRWRIFFAMLPLWIAGLTLTVVVFGLLQRHADSRVLVALVDSLFSVLGQWSTVLVLLLYLGLAGPGQVAFSGARAQHKNKRLRRAA